MKQELLELWVNVVQLDHRDYKDSQAHKDYLDCLVLKENVDLLDTKENKENQDFQVVQVKLVLLVQ